MEHNEKTQILKDVNAKVDDTRDKSTVRMIDIVGKNILIFGLKIVGLFSRVNSNEMFLTIFNHFDA